MRTNDKRRIEKGEMRNRFFGSAIFLLSAFCFLLFISCDKQEIESFDSQKDTPISIASTGVTELITRVITDDNKLEGTQDNPATMSVFVIGGSLDKYNTTNMKWEHKGAEWQSPEAAPVYFAGVNSVQQIYACSPYFDNSEGSITVDVTTDQTDWLVATAIGLSSNLVNLTMTHALSKLVLKPTFGTEVTNQTITSVEVGGMYASGTLNIANNQWSNLGEANATLEMKNNELLVIPMEATSFRIVITMEDGRIFTTDISLAQASNQLAPGTQYNISLQVGQDKVTLGNIIAEPWTSITGGELATE